MPDIAVKIKQLVSEKLQVNESEITNETSFIKDLHLDSIGLIQLIVEVEKLFKINVPDEEIEKMDTVGSLIRYVTKRIYK